MKWFWRISNNLKKSIYQDINYFDDLSESIKWTTHFSLSENVDSILTMEKYSNY